MKATAVLREPELTEFRKALKAFAGGEARLSTFGSDLEAIQAVYIEGMPQVLVVDLDLESVIGLEFIRTFKTQGGFEGLPVFVVSSADRRMEAYDAQAAVCLVRPVLAGRFLEALKAFCASAAAPEAPPAKAPPPKFEGPETRRASRKPLQTACIVATAGQKLKGLLKDISLSGARIEVNGKLEQGDLITLIIGVPGTVPLKVVEFKARVVRQTGQGYGLAFRQMDPDTRTFVQAYTQKE
ncbi:MAG: PilZ domain-containing protein [Acidobacteriota bacterium]